MRAQRPILCAAALLAAAAACRSAREEPPPPERERGPSIDERLAQDRAGEGLETVEHEVVARGDQPSLSGPMARVFRSQAGWEGAWAEAPATHVGEQRQAPDVADVVDWSDQMLAVIALGERPSAGYGVEVLGVERSGGFLRIRARETKPAPDSMQAQVVTQPYVVLRLPRFEGPVVFVIE